MPRRKFVSEDCLVSEAAPGDRSDCLPVCGNGKPRRQDLAPGDNLCDYCVAKCCRYFALPIDEPATRRDFDYLRWFLLHDRASIFTESGTWYLLVHTPCKHLEPDNRCGIYDRRPQVCREYTTADCEYHENWTYERYFETAEQVEEYVEAIFPKQPGESIRSERRTEV